MVLSVPANTYAALQNARQRGIIERDFVWIEAVNTSTDEVEHIGLWSGEVPVSVQVFRPSDGVAVTRTYQPIGERMQIQSIPSTMKLEVRTVNITFSGLSFDILNAVVVYQPRRRPIQIHRGLYDPDTMNLVDPAWCRLDGFTNRAPIRRGKVDGESTIRIEAQSHAYNLTFGNPAKLSDEFFKRRGGDGSGRYLDVVPKIVWGQETIVHEGEKRPKEHFFS